MNTYEIRTNCEYVIEVLANSADEAESIAKDIPYRDWSQAWAPWETELYSTEEEEADA